MNKSTVLAIDDDITFQDLMRQYMEQQGYRFLSLPHGSDVLQNMENENPDIILLDLTPMEDNGLALLSTIRSKSKAAVILTSAKCAVVDKIIGLEMGADDYLTKPFELRELLARIRAVLRRTATDNTPVNDTAESPLAKADHISFNGWVLNRLQYQLFDENGTSAELTSGEFKLLEALVMAPHRALTRQYLFEITHHADLADFDRAIDIQIGRLRKKINDDPHNPVLIKTLRGVGYMFTGEPKASV